jgi:16S rRNA (adenine1518-N6/adenine1519-N6)-dimethyltransferase
MVRQHTLPTLSETLKKYHLFPQKGLGQNFILQPALLSKIISYAGDLSRTHVVEIGAGPGGLTRALLHTPCLSVTAVEKDSRCIPALEELKAFFPERLHIIHGDALEMDWKTMLPTPYTLVGNLPYHISVPLLLQWLDALACFDQLLLMFQAEVADRLTARPETKAYGRLSVLTQWCCQAKSVLKLSPGAFTPPPKVASTVVRLIPHPSLAGYPALKPSLERVTAAAFNQRRKMLRSSLKALWPDPLPYLEEAQIDPTKRAESLDIEAFLALSHLWDAFNTSRF